VHYQIAAGVQLKPIWAGKRQSDSVRIGFGSYDKIVLQMALIAVIDKIDAAVDSGITDLGIGRNISSSF